MFNSRNDILDSSSKQELSIKEIYTHFLQSSKQNQYSLYTKRKSWGEIFNGELEDQHPQLQLDDKALSVVLNFSLLIFVAWKDNVIKKEELSQTRYTFSILKSFFPRDNFYNERAMNRHIRSFIAFLMCDFEFQYLTQILNFLQENPLPIDRNEMNMQLGIMSMIDEHEDIREKAIIEEILDCFYHKTMSVESFISKMKNEIDFTTLKESATQVPELQPYLLSA